MEDRSRNQDLNDRGIDNNLKGIGKDLKGRVKDAAGGLTGDESLQAEGKWDRVKGKIQETLGDAQRDIARERDENEQV